MDTTYKANIAKWLPPSESVIDKWLIDSSLLDKNMRKLIGFIPLIIHSFTESQTYNIEVLDDVIRSLEKLIESYKLACTSEELSIHPIYKYKINYLSMVLKRRLNVVAKFTRNLISDIINCKNETTIKIILRLINAYNDILDINRDELDSSVNVFYNDCPHMLEPLKKISVTKILQMLAKNRAEECCHELIDCLLVNYEPREKTESTSNTNDLDHSENSSFEIYRALTRHLTPPTINTVSVSEMEMSNIESVQVLVNTQNEQVLRLLNIVQQISPQLLGTDALKTVKGESKLRNSAIKRVKNYYQEVAWGALSGILDHVILWWSREALATHHSHGAQHFKDWLRQFMQENDIPPTVTPALQNLCDALEYHTTITVWDQMFRLAYTSAFECQSKPSVAEGTNTGQMFIELFRLLVTLSNECEANSEWVTGAPLIELPLSEQIVVLHRMDHSIHTARLWTIQEAKIIANTWELNVFFLLVKGDIMNCLKELSHLKLADHATALSTNSVDVQVYVCAKMRAKIVSEVKTNTELLQICPAKCIDTLAKICRVISLANLHMCFPRLNYWSINSNVIPTAASLYVETYFEKVLLPVLKVIEDQETPSMILRIMCEAWLDYIYLHRIKFSEYGALQLLTDFAYVSSWVTECSIISQDVRERLLKNEVLRRCEGVGRLLLRHPGEAIAMHKRLAQKTNERGSPESPGLERMPAEMYVPNQEQWLDLRAPKGYNFCCKE